MGNRGSWKQWKKKYSSYYKDPLKNKVTEKQLGYLKRLGFNVNNAVTMSKAEASYLIANLILEKKSVEERKNKKW
jgi:hypothetical protein